MSTCRRCPAGELHHPQDDCCCEPRVITKYHGIIFWETTPPRCKSPQIIVTRQHCSVLRSRRWPSQQPCPLSDVKQMMLTNPRLELNYVRLLFVCLTSPPILSVSHMSNCPIFPVELITSRIGDLTRLIHALLLYINRSTQKLSMLIPEKAAPVNGTALRATGPARAESRQ